jgi:hypothetical protein
MMRPRRRISREETRGDETIRAGTRRKDPGRIRDAGFGVRVDGIETTIEEDERDDERGGRARDGSVLGRRDDFGSRVAQNAASRAS